MEGGSKPCNRKIQLCDPQTNVMLKFIASGLGRCGKHPNEDSIVSKITYNGVSTLISGDFEGNNGFMSDLLMLQKLKLKRIYIALPTTVPILTIQMVLNQTIQIY